MEEKTEYISLSTLKERGWTDSIIKKMGLEPDKLVRNPHYRSASPMKLYALKRIEELEKSEQFIVLFSKAKPRKDAAKKAISTKIAKLFAYVDSIEIEVEYIPEPQLTRDAIDAYNMWQANRPSVANGKREGFRAGKDSDKAFLARIKSNYIRHNLTNYNEILEDIKGQVGISEAYPELKKRVQDRIATEWNNQKNKPRERSVKEIKAHYCKGSG